MEPLPRATRRLALCALLVGGLGGSRALVADVLPYLGSQEELVSARRHELELRNQATSPEVDSDIIRRAGDEVGERAWARRGINLPLGIANVLLSALLFFGAFRSLARSSSGLSTWQFASQLNIPYTLLAALVSLVEARDAVVGNTALAINMALKVDIPAERLATFELWRERAFTCVGAAGMIAFYVFSFFYLRRPKVRALFSE